MISMPRPTAKELESLKDLVARYGEHAAYYTSPSNNYNEHSCRDEYINPLLKILGWDVENTRGVAPQYREIIAENYSSDSERPDYTLTVSGTPIFFVEAKKPSINISHAVEPALQTRKYGWNAGHAIAVLTNFDELVIYDCAVMPSSDDEPHVARYRKFKYDEYVSRFDELYALISRESVFGGYFNQYTHEEILSASSEKQRVDKVFLEQINKWRLELAKSLLGHSSQFTNEERLNDAVQDFINQIVFLRVCEDKNLPIYHKLYELDKDNVISSMMELLRAADRRYNSGLFAQTSALHFVDGTVVKDIVATLYYPQSPYLFDIIDSNLFGQIYEMFLSEHLIIDESGKPKLARKREYKDRSVVATPVEVAKYIINRTLRPLCEGKNADEIKSLRIADMSCGSGIFLLEAFQYLIDWCVDWRYDNDRSSLVQLENGKYKLSLTEKKDILSSCLFGIDIDIHAVEVTKFSLLIKLIEEETSPTVEEIYPILPNLDSNIMIGNALVTPKQATDARANQNEMEVIVPFDWGSINDGHPFDAIVGNPPYVKTEDMRSLLPEAEFRVYKNSYKSSHKQFDKYFLFIEKSLELLNPGGYACFIVSNKFFKIAAGKMLREVISVGQFLDSLDDFGDSQLFEDKTIYSSILCLRNEPHDVFTYASVKSPNELWCKNANNEVELETSSLDSNPWRLSTDIAFMKQLKQVEENAVPLANHVVFFNGIQTSAERKRNYWFLHGEIIAENDSSLTFLRNGEEWEIERTILRPYFKPTEEHGFNSYSPLVCDKWLIFPYDMEGKLIPKNTMEKRFPGAWKYLLSQKNDLWPKQLEGSGRRDVSDATEDTWYQYGRAQALASFNGQEKIIVGVLSEQPLYYVDRNNWVIASGGTAGYCGIRMKPDSPYSLEYIQAWLSNRHTEKIFDMIGSDFEGGFKSRGTSLLSTLPFLELNLNDPEQRALYREVVELSKRVQAINALLLDNPSKKRATVLGREKENAIARIEDLIDRVYSLEFVNEA